MLRGMSRQRAVRFVRRPSRCGASNPTGLLTAATSTQINLSWTASAGAAGYKIYKDGPYLKSVATTSASDMGLTATTSYCYSVSAYDSANNESAQTSQLCAYGPPPAVPAGVTASACHTQVNISWTASAGALQYKIYRNGGTAGDVDDGLLFRYGGGCQYPKYIYTVTAIDATGSESGQSTQSFAHTGLTVPSMVTAMVNSSTQITISWANSGGSLVTDTRFTRVGHCWERCRLPRRHLLSMAD